jgi:hypothetical protein
MEQIKQTTLKKAIVLLNAIGAQYAIIDADGKKHGDLEIVEQRKRKPSAYEYGELTNYCRTYFKDLAVGDVQVFPIGNYPIEVMQRTLSSWICKNYGNGTHTTCMSENRQSIEILRIA